MKYVTHYDCILPAWSLSAIINDDYSGLEDEEENLLNTFLKTMNNKVEKNQYSMWSYESENEPYFRHSNDLHNLGDTVVDIMFAIYTNEQEVNKC